MHTAGGSTGVLMALGRTLLVSGLAATSAFLWACDGQSIATGRVTTATPSKAKGGYAVSINSIAAKKIGEDRYNYNKSVSIKFETTGSLQVSSAESDKPSGLLAIVYAESSGILEQGTAPEIMYVPVHNGEARLRIVEYESIWKVVQFPQAYRSTNSENLDLCRSSNLTSRRSLSSQMQAATQCLSEASVQSVFKAQAQRLFQRPN